MVFVKVEEREYGNYIQAANTNTANRVYPSSIAEGFQKGEIYVTKEDGAPVLFWHACGFAYLTGSVTEEYLDALYEAFLLDGGARARRVQAGKKEVGTEGVGRRFLLITNDPFTTTYLRGKEKVQTNVRLEYRYPQDSSLLCISDSPKSNPMGTSTAAEMVQGYRVEPITPVNLEKIHGRIIPAFSWPDASLFFANGFGYVALDGDKAVSVAFSSAVSDAEVDIGVETDEAYRGQGLAGMLAKRMCEDIVARGKRPVWAHASTNLASGRTAIGAGFVLCQENTVIRLTTG